MEWNGSYYVEDTSFPEPNPLDDDASRFPPKPYGDPRYGYEDDEDDASDFPDWDDSWEDADDDSWKDDHDW